MAINYGIIGGGVHAFWGHALPSRYIDGIELKGVYDVSNFHEEHFRREYPDLRWYASEDELLRDVDAIIVASPDRFHAKTLAKAVGLGKHVFVEKPVALDASELRLARRAIGEAEANRLVVSTCHPGRFEPATVFLRENLPMLTEELGAVLFYHYDFSYQRPGDLQGWHRERSLLLDHATHEIDTLHHLLGPAKGEARRVCDAFDRYEVTGEHGGVSFRFHGTRKLAPNAFRGDFSVRFERGTATVAVIEGEAFEHSGVATVANHETNVARTYDCRPNFPGYFHSVNKTFFDAIAGAGRNYISTDDILFNAEFAIALASEGSYAWDTRIARSDSEAVTHVLSGAAA